MNFTNSGSQSIGNGNWAIYFHHIRMIERQKISPNGTMLGNSGLRVHHYNGVLFWLEPTAEFLGLSPGQTLKIQFIASDWTVSRTDIMPNWYVVSRGQDCNDIRLILSTVGESLNFVSSFETSKQWKRLTKDLYDPLTPEARYSSDYVADSGVPVRKIIPTPLSESYTGETVNLKMASFVVITPDDQSIHNEATFLAGKQLFESQIPGIPISYNMFLYYSTATRFVCSLCVCVTRWVMHQLPFCTMYWAGFSQLQDHYCIATITKSLQHNSPYC